MLADSVVSLVSRSRIIHLRHGLPLTVRHTGLPIAIVLGTLAFVGAWPSEVVAEKRAVATVPPSASLQVAESDANGVVVVVQKLELNGVLPSAFGDWDGPPKLLPIQNADAADATGD